MPKTNYLITLLACCFLPSLWGFIEQWEAALFQVPFVFRVKKTLQLRVNRKHLGLVPVGRPFIGPDGKVISRDGRTFCGFDTNREQSALSFAQIKSYRRSFRRLLQDTVYAGGDEFSHARRGGRDEPGDRARG